MTGNTCIGLAIIIGISLNIFDLVTVAPDILSFLLGCLISIGVGFTVTSRKASPVVLEDEEEWVFRKQQYIVGIIISILLIS